jgi:ketosteroid isomerase-like protein
MSGTTAPVRAVYQALQSRHVPGLKAALRNDVEATLSSGLPLDLGGRYVGLTEVLGMWAAVARHFDIRPEPEEYIESVEPHVVVVRGWYRGTARSTGRNLEAAFVHIWGTRDGQVQSLLQITDTARWATSL